MYANHGIANRSAVKLRGTGAVVLRLNSGNTYRFRPDGDQAGEANMPNLLASLLQQPTAAKPGP